MKAYIVKSWSSAHGKQRITRVEAESEEQAKQAVRNYYRFDKIESVTLEGQQYGNTEDNRRHSCN